MKGYLFISGIFVLNFLTAGLGLASPNDVRIAFSKFQTALLSHDGESAAQYVSHDTLHFYNDVRELALDAKTAVFELESQIKVSMALEFRYLLSKRDLQWLSDGKKIFAWMVKNKLFQKQRFNECSLVNIKVEGEHAFASVLENGRIMDDILFEFIKENGVWKLDMMKQFSSDDMALEILRQQTGKNKIELALFLLKKNYRKNISDRILSGPLK